VREHVAVEAVQIEIGVIGKRYRSPATGDRNVDYGKLSAGEIAEAFPVSGAAVSKHLSVLKDADLIRDAREGKFIFYELNTSVLEEVMMWLVALKGEEK
jgi:DNA-binding transcriptional ArsR family regulator